MDGPKGERSESSRDFEAVKALDSSFRWNDEQKFPAIEDLKFGALPQPSPRIKSGAGSTDAGEGAHRGKRQTRS